MAPTACRCVCVNLTLFQEKGRQMSGAPTRRLNHSVMAQAVPKWLDIINGGIADVQEKGLFPLMAGPMSCVTGILQHTSSWDMQSFFCPKPTFMSSPPKACSSQLKFYSIKWLLYHIYAITALSCNIQSISGVPVKHLSACMRILRHWAIACCRMASEAFKGQFMKIEAPNGFVEWTENCSCHFDLEKAISCQSRCRRGFSQLLDAIIHKTHFDQY